MVRNPVLGAALDAGGRAILGITISHLASGPDARGPADFGVRTSTLAGTGTGTVATTVDLAAAGAEFGRVCSGVWVMYDQVTGNRNVAPHSGLKSNVTEFSTSLLSHPLCGVG